MATNGTAEVVHGTDDSAGFRAERQHPRPQRSAGARAATSLVAMRELHEIENAEREIADRFGTSVTSC